MQGDQSGWRHVVGQRRTTGNVQKPPSPVPERSAYAQRMRKAAQQRFQDEQRGIIWDPDEIRLGHRRAGGDMARGNYGSQHPQSRQDDEYYDNYDEEAPVIQQRVSPRQKRERVDPNYRNPRPRRRRHFHWLFYLGVIFVLLIGFVQVLQFAAGALSSFNDAREYGYPRTEQKDFVVGHSDSSQHPSHFIAVNLHGQAVIIELQGGNAKKSYSYLGPDLLQQTGGDLLPLDMTLVDVNGDHKPDIKVTEGLLTWYLINTGTSFTVQL